MKTKIIFVAFLLFVAKFVWAFPEIDPKLIKSFEKQNQANIFITMKEGTGKILQAASISAKSSTNASRTRGEKITAIRDILHQHAEESQKTVLQLVQSRKTSTMKVKSFWITNRVYVQGADKNLVESLRENKDIVKIEEEKIIQLEISEVKITKIPDHAQWGVVLIQAPKVWNMADGNSGEGITVGIIDSGVRRTHEALNSSYRDDGFSWFDPYEGTSVPNDDNGHGTHACGTVVGQGGIGVAPGAQWMACKGCGTTSCTEVALLLCGQFMFCPTDPTGEFEDCGKAPYVVTNSWGSDGGDSYYIDVTAAWHSIGIIPVFAFGNEGNDCSTGGSPGDQVDVIAVGATTMSDSLACFSSVGPTIDGRIKPDISAPGYFILSAWNTSDSEYNEISGTSMACPHVSGLVALLLRANPDLDFNSIKSIIEESADKDLLFSSRTCGGRTDNEFPNNHFGHGRINAYKAVEMAKAAYNSSSNLSGVYWMGLIFGVLSIISAL